MGIIQQIVNIMIIVSVFCPKLIFFSSLALIVKLLKDAWVPMTLRDCRGLEVEHAKNEKGKTKFSLTVTNSMH